MTEWRTAAGAVELGERPVWDEREGRLVWVEINAGRLHHLDEQGDHVAFEVEGTLGAAALRAVDGYVLASGDSFVITDPEGVEQERLATPRAAEPVRFNDGACDPAGRFWAGTASTHETAGAGSLYYLEPSGNVVTVLGGVTESNGICWSPDGATFYHTDSGETPSRIRAYDFDPDTAALGKPRDLIVFSEDDGIADGLTIDADGCIWAAMWEGSSIIQIAPDGSRVETLRMPVSRPTCVAFGGQDFEELFVTSAWEGMDERHRTAEPMAGCVLVAATGVGGAPALRFGG
jgi:sugar lactone lactonase YvrE